MNPRRIGFGALILLGLTTVAVAQTVPFQLVVTQATAAITVQNGANVTFISTVGQTQTATLKAIYNGSGQVTISQQPNVFGSTAFTATIDGALPLTLSPGASVSVTIQFTPTSAAQSSAQINLAFFEALTATTSNSGTILLGLTGTAPAFTLSYILQTDQNVVGLQSGDIIPFAATLVGTTAQAALNVSNTGSAPGSVTGITITSGAFRLQQKPLFPATVPAGQSLQVFVLYTPTAVAADTGQITITFASGSTVTINLSGSGSSPSFTYQILSANPPVTISPGGTIALPDTNVGQSSSLTIRVLNSGNANGTVNSIALGGQGFQISNGPPAFPQILAPNASLTFSVNFAPSQPGALTGTLIVNADTFKLTGTGLGSLLTFSYVAGGSTITLSATNTSVVFSPAQVTQSESLVFDVKNTGTLAATISNIGIASGPYTLSGLPPLPVTLSPNGDFQITIKFTPLVVGPSNGSLLLDATAIPLIGSGTQPPALPSYTITGPSGTVTPMTQPTVGLSLASPYPVAITGTLTMSVVGTLPVDPAVLFATSGRTVSFIIPANQMAAVFGAQGTQLGLQTGTVASNITLTPTFATLTGSVDLTPATPKVLQFAVAPAAPALIALQLTGLSATGFTIQATGFATTRSLTSFAIQFATNKGFTLATSQYSIDVKQISTLWFQSTASQAFGGQFTMSIPFTFQGALPVGQSVVSAIASVSVTMSNELGASNQLQATLQ